MKHARKDYDRFQDPDKLIPEDEPVFLLRAQDKCAVEAVYHWANEAEQAGASDSIVLAARTHASAMKAWTKKKVPDMPSTIDVTSERFSKQERITLRDALDFMLENPHTKGDKALEITVDNLFKKLGLV